MAELVVMGDFQGPGERKTAERLSAELPAGWVVFAGRKLPGEQRADLDLVVVAERGVFVLEEKAWGPELLAEDAFWYVKGEARRNPIDRVAHVSRVLASKLRSAIPDYARMPGRGHRVVAGVILSHDHLRFVRGASSDQGELILPLAQAAGLLLRRDAVFEPGFERSRAQVIRLLRGLPASDAAPAVLGPYAIEQRLAPVGRAQCFLAIADGDPALLRCYPLHGWGDTPAPMEAIRREAVVLRRLADIGRAYRPAPVFKDEARQWVVIPMVPPKDGRSLTLSQRKADPPRPGGVLPAHVARFVVTDAFKALASVHSEGVVHRGLHPRRIELGRGLRVRFTDFYLARLEGSGTITPWLDGLDEDLGRPYRAPECEADIRFAQPASDVYALALSLAMWLGGDLTSNDPPDVRSMRGALAELDVVGAVLADCLNEAPEDRPSAQLAVERLLVGADGPSSGRRVAAPAGGAAQRRPVFAVGGVIEGRYTLKRRLGSGSNATTWLAYDEQHQDSYVIKQFRNERVAGLARQEFSAAKQLSHDRCARVWDVYPTPEPGFLVHQYIEGTSLAEASAETAMDVSTLKRVTLDLLDALAYIHGKDLVHGDISLNNIIVTPGGNGVLIDFGLAGRAGSSQGGGTPLVMAPEVLRGRPVTASSDLYCLGATLLFAMLGRPPYAGDPGDGAARDVTPAPPSDDERLQWGAEGCSLLDVLFAAIAVDPAGRPDAVTLARMVRATGPARPAAGVRAANPTVDGLRRLYRGSLLGNAGNRGLDDEFARATYVPTRLDLQLLPDVLAGRLQVVLLSGNPGDGKTAFLVKVGEALRARGATVLADDDWGWRLDLGGRHFVAVYDASESHGSTSSDDLVRSALLPAPGTGPHRHTALVAINDGRLLQFLADNEQDFPQLAAAVHAQLGGDPISDGIALVDLKRRSLATFDGSSGPAADMARSFTDPERWAACETCASRSRCPILHNAEALRGPAAGAFGELVLTSHLRRRRRATFRDVRSALAWLITADKSCDDVHGDRERGLDVTWSPARLHDLAFAAGSGDYLVREWSDLDPALVAAPDVERAARLDPRLTPDLTAFDRSAASSALRQCFMGVWSAPGISRTAARAYRYLDEFVAMLAQPDRPGALARILLGMSRIAGAPGFRGDGMALGDRNSRTGWAVLSQVPARAFTLATEAPASPFVEWIPDRLTLRHVGGAALTFTLDTAELVLRAADGEVLADLDSDAVRQDIDAFTARVGYEGVREVHVVDPLGRPTRAVLDGDVIRLQEA